jgi:radical SAM protein
MTPRHRYERAPLRVYWETTRACDLACRHCRARAEAEPAPGELSTAEGRTLLERLAVFAPRPKVVLTGGDPLKRGDLFELICHGRALGLGVAVAPSGTPLLTAPVVDRLARAGVEAISLSVDGATAAAHDAVRGVPGCFERTRAAAAAARQAGIAFQVNTLVAGETAADLPAVHRLVTEMGAARWSLFFLIAVGRGAVLTPVTAERAEALLEWLAGLPAGPPVVTTTEAPFFRRVVRSRRSAGGHPGTGHGGGGGAHGAGIRDGNGIVFVGHTGDITPSGFLELVAGNVRTHDIGAVYRDAPLFRALREPDGFGGRCGYCEYRELCGGSRARAWAATGDPLAEDPLCAYVPAASASGAAAMRSRMPWSLSVPSACAAHSSSSAAKPER